MVSKRKRPNMALMQDDINTGEQATPDTPSFAPRRSGRKLQHTGYGLCPDANAAGMEKSSSEGVRSKVKQQKSNGRKGVDVALDGLKEMEDSLKDAVKRQKLAVKSSSVISSHDSTAEDAIFMPRPLKPSPDVIGAGRGKKKTASGNVDPSTQGKSPNGKPDELVHDRDGPAADETGPVDVATFKQEGARQPPVNSDYLPLPWKGRLGYACLNTYLRLSNPPVFSSRTCRISSILEHRHPLQDPAQPEHATKNRPDKSKPADAARGQKYVEALGLANARDIVKMIRWNDKYGIKFMRLSSEMFPFASHEDYGYKLAPFASAVLAEAGKGAGELGHRLTTHPGQFTQLGSPRPEVVRNAIRDLEYHNELLSLLRLPEQQNKDAVMVLHMGGTFGDKAATLKRFRENYAKLSQGIKARLVLENDDVSWTVHDLLPICEELNIPMVLDFHHHNILFDPDKVREGTKDIMELFPRIKATWDRKGITQKMHYSEPCAEAVTGRQRRKHSARVMTLPPCANDMDLMIEAKDKEQAVFNLMRNYRLPGWDKCNDIVPYERDDENRPAPKTPKKKKLKSKKAGDDNDVDEDTIMEEPMTHQDVPSEEVGMGGPNRRVFWPVGMEEWLRPKKREVKKVEVEDIKT
ncbi:UV-damage endonuclease [Pseudomassariella vexata]|uniref:UV-damage endonuclease n=1 Tax=Pseudomassariella vexata TaxID=1141098 RepID=A0A1Y2EKN3_9PEZI|nr:UV-damage endonuclease [Pseudomassariella vexata]ORY72103.1 UV-damage endonuclease [Pseudomassariella vexata]